MESSFSKPEVKHLDSRLFSDLQDTINTLLAENSEPLPAEELDEDPHTEIGQRREIVSDANGSVIVARYKESERDYATSAISNTTGLQMERLFGHIEARYASEGATIDAGLYLAGDRRVVGLVACKLNNEDQVLMEGSQACYEFAADLGLQDTWAAHMFSGEKRGVYQVELTTRQVRSLIEFLSTPPENNTSG